MVMKCLFIPCCVVLACPQNASPQLQGRKEVLPHGFGAKESQLGMIIGVRGRKRVLDSLCHPPCPRFAAWRSVHQVTYPALLLNAQITHSSAQTHTAVAPVLPEMQDQTLG